MGGRRRELALAGGRHPLQQRCSRRCRHRLLPPLVVILLLAVVASSQTPTAVGSIFGSGDDSASECSRTCESQHCTAPLMRYGKYCGVSYTGCPGEAPCDAIDACCMLHDQCVQATDNDYLNMWCNQSLLDCVAAARPTAAAVATTFQGNQCNVTDVADEITTVVEAAVYARGILHKP